MPSDETVRALQEAERQLEAALPELDKAEQCGIECTTLRQTAVALRERIAALRKSYPDFNRMLDPRP